MALTEIKLVGKLDLSMWRGSDDDEEDRDSSSIDLSPLPIFTTTAPSANNHNNNVANLATTTPHHHQTPTKTQKTHDDDGAYSGINTTTSVLGSTNFLHTTTVRSGEKLEWDDEDDGTVNNHLKRVQLHPVESHNTQSHAQHYSNKNNLLVATNSGLLDGRESSNLTTTTTATKEQSRGGVKKVEFSEEAGKVSSSMLQEVNPAGSNGSNSKDKIGKVGALPGKRTPRSPSGSLLLEIRKMSLASQDAEEEKKKQSASSTTTTKRVRRIRRRKREEEYTDKDRAAAVTLGSRDIKQSLKAKKKRERKMNLSLDFMNSEEYLASMLVVEALYQLRVRKTPQAALVTLNKCLELQPTHKGALVARSQCHIRIGNPDSALKDAETSFGKNETFIQGLYQGGGGSNIKTMQAYGEALFQLAEFEKSLIAFHQGYRLRKDMEGFRIGIQKSQDAIKRAIGGRTATKMNNLEEVLSIIEELQESKRKAVSTCKDEDLLINILKRRFGDKTVSNTKSQSKPKNQWITREVLGQMYMDKEYLAKFIHRPDVKQQMGNAEALRDVARDGLKYLEGREKFWRQQNPLYSRPTNVTNVINNNSLLSKLNSLQTTPSVSGTGIRAKKSLEKVHGQTLFPARSNTTTTSTPRSTLKTPIALNKTQSLNK